MVRNLSEIRLSLIFVAIFGLIVASLLALLRGQCQAREGSRVVPSRGHREYNRHYIEGTIGNSQ